MIIRVDEEGRNVVASLIDTAIKAGAFQGVKHIQAISGAIQSIAPEKVKPEEKEAPDVGNGK